jgi:iron complex outermembrane receptor protein
MKLILHTLSLVALSTFLGFTAHSQTGSIQGKITSEKGDALPGINLSIEGTSLGSASNSDGNFLIQNIPAGEYTLRASGVGFNATKQNVKVFTGKTTDLNLQLNESTNQLDEIIVTGGVEYRQEISSIGSRSDILLLDLPQSAQVVTRKVLDEQNAYRITDALRNVAGVNEGYWNSIVFRGFETNFRQYLYNGQRGLTTGEDFSQTLANIERVEVIRGPAGALYGNGALGGTLNIISKQPKFESSRYISATIGSFNTYRFLADFTGAMNSKKSLAYRLNVGYENAGKFTKDWNQKNVLIAPSILWNISDKTSITFNGTYYWDERTNNYDPGVPVYQADIFKAPYDLNVNNTDSKFKANNFSAQVNAKHELNENWNLNLWGNFTQQNNNVNVYAFYSPPAINGNLDRVLQRFDNDIPTFSNNLFLNGKFNTGKISHALTVGVDTWYQNWKVPTGFAYYTVLSPTFNVLVPTYGDLTLDDPNNFYYSSFESYKYTTYSAYLQDQLSFFDDKLKALIGLRFENFSYDYLAKYNPGDSDFTDDSKADVLVPRFGLVYKITAAASVYGSYTQGFNPQNSANRQAGGPFPPVRGNQLEFGLKNDLIKNALTTTVAVYQISQRNVLVPIPNTNLRQATGEIISKGIELTVTGTIAKGWNLIANYAFNNTEVTESSIEEQIGRQFTNAPKNSGNIWTTYTISQHTLKGLKFGLGYKAMSERNTAIGPNNPVLPAFGIWDAMIAYHLQGFDINLNLNNITDKKYFTGSLNNAAAFYGVPRSFVLTLGYRF